MSDKEGLCAGCLKDIDLGSEEIWSVEIKLTAAPHATDLEDLDAEEAGRRMRALINELNETSVNEAERSVVRRTRDYLCDSCANKFDDDPFEGLSPPK